MLNILFVDDEPRILEGLKRMLRSMRGKWQMNFALGGVDAIDLLESMTIDVVVSDMRMPGMDGAQLLNRVRERFPHIVRIVLSGYADKEMVNKAVAEAHQYLAKPCDAETLIVTVERACSFNRMVTNERLRGVIAKLRTVPSLPKLYSEFTEELKLSYPSVKKIGEIVKGDIGMTVKLLQIVNSGFFGLGRPISDAEEAVRFLGLGTVSSLTRATGVFSHFEEDSRHERIFAKLRNHSLAVGKAAWCIANLENPKIANDAFTAGLIHNIGIVLLTISLPKEYGVVSQLIEREEMTRSEAEKQVLGTTHAEIGAYLLGLWGLPASIVEAVAFHHIPNEYESLGFTGLTAIHAADAILHSIRKDTRKSAEDLCDREYLENLGMLGRLPAWSDECAKESKDSPELLFEFQGAR